MAEAVRDYYEILGVPEDASQDQIRKAYLELAKKYHPDKTGGDKAAEEKLKEVNDAYDTLKKPDKRREYDASRSNPFAHAGAGDASGMHAGFDSGDPYGAEFGSAFFGDIFSDLFGQAGASRQGQSHARRARRGNDLEVPVTVSLRDVLSGTRKTLHIPRRVACTACQGTGSESGETTTCGQCGGTGRVSQSRGSVFMARTCGQCGGEGQVIARPCRSCEGTGQSQETKGISVNIPAGVRDGTRLRVAGQGEGGAHGGPPGDLFVLVHVAADELFRRTGDDVEIDVPVSFTQAVLGDAIEVPTLTGKAKLRIPAGTQSGQVLRLRGQGLPSVDGRRKGQLLVRVHIEVPAQLTPEQRAAVERLRELENAATYPKRRAFAEKVQRYSGPKAAAAAVIGLATLASLIL